MTRAARPRSESRSSLSEGRAAACRRRHSSTETSTAASEPCFVTICGPWDKHASRSSPKRALAFWMDHLCIAYPVATSGTTLVLASRRRLCRHLCDQTTTDLSNGHACLLTSDEFSRLVGLEKVDRNVARLWITPRNRGGRAAHKALALGRRKAADETYVSKALVLGSGVLLAVRTMPLADHANLLRVVPMSRSTLASDRNTRLCSSRSLGHTR